MGIAYIRGAGVTVIAINGHPHAGPARARVLGGTNEAIITDQVGGNVRTSRVWLTEIGGADLVVIAVDEARSTHTGDTFIASRAR